MLSTRSVAILLALTLGANQNFFEAPAKQVEGTSMKKVFATLFPFESPAWNSILATFYISSIPNFILLAVPASLDMTSLNTMISFATGGLLGDVFLHLVPHAFFGEGHEVGRSLVVEEKRNIVIGGAIFLGFACFFVLDKSMRVLSSSAGGEGSHHSHSHSHSNTHVPSGRSSSIETEKENELRQRKTPVTDSASADSKAASASQDEKAVKETNPSLKLSAYLNLFGDFTHNITDGLAMAASFYSSPALGAVTTIATFCHEIPHEIADYSILIKSGFTKSQAMGSQFFTAVGAFVGTFLGIWIAETSGAGNAGAHGEGIRLNIGEGLFGTSVAGGELVIPMTAGGFLYIASVSVIPELLGESRSGKQALKEYAAMAFGVFCMGVIAWNE
ncbi:solute carrier family 39 (zinc transporter), member 7 [Cryptococcus gattii E566]|uniref:Solute carrier family 39 (Zinc transporter), member 7 n=1 Tax=Cryptococcus gattii EJB2 TaxID=1296103 RepID=A0ABR5C2F3_9TREE|nr:solute carrier family 39 (zinc transporter), member 7 [Cryptococcus gattii EJB2]KIY36578.1 solute carrier family 39 (zinc transporter), member 7 [Cryptococcus gattii E566]KJE04551.1 solute carrier family 39 (zinc transporter), member 7 [Cryptococcus gattii NT-10]